MDSKTRVPLVVLDVRLDSPGLDRLGFGTYGTVVQLPCALEGTRFRVTIEALEVTEFLEGSD
jgi:hypothetical protein